MSPARTSPGSHRAATVSGVGKVLRRNDRRLAYRVQDDNPTEAAGFRIRTLDKPQKPEQRRRDEQPERIDPRGEHERGGGDADRVRGPAGPPAPQEGPARGGHE